MTHAPFPSDETLAAFIDGRLDEETRQRVTEHMSDCGECHSILLAANEFRGEDERRGSRPAAAVVPFRRWLAVAATLSAAAAIAAIIFLTPLRDRLLPSRGLMVQLAESQPAKRKFSGRLAQIPYRPFESPTRGVADDDPLKQTDDDTLKFTARRVAVEAEQHPTAANLHAVGAAYLMLGRWDDAVRQMERAVMADADARNMADAIRTSRSAALLTDLSAAYSARARELQQAGDRVAAVNAATRAWQIEKNPVTAWNRAVALEALPPSRDDVVKAWRDFLAISDSKEASAEATSELSKLGSDTDSELWQRVRPRLVAGTPTATFASDIRRFRQEAREWIEDELLPEWGRAVDTKQAAVAADRLTLARTAARVLRDAGGDALDDDSIAAIDAALPAARLVLARAHARFGEARHEYRDAHIPAARQTFAEARALMLRGGSPFAVKTSVYLASCAYASNDYRSAIDMTDSLREALLRHPSYIVAAGLASWVRGISRASLGEVNETVEDYEQALSLFTRAGEGDNALAVKSMLATIYDSIGDDERAWAVRCDALRLLQTYGHGSRREPLVLNSAAHAALRDEQPYAAMLFADRQLEESMRREWKDIAVQALVWRSDVRASLGDSGSAARDARMARDVATTIEDGSVRAFMLSEPGLVRALIRAAAPAERITTVQQAIDFATKTGNALRRAELLALLGSEYARDGRLIDAETTLNAAATEIERQRPGLSDRQLVDAYSEKRRGVYHELVRLALLRNDPARALAALERGRELANDEANVAMLALPPSATAIVFSADDDSLLTWSLHAGKLAFVRTAITGRDVAVLISTLQATVREPERFDAAAERLSAFFVAPWIAAARGSDLVVFVVDDTTAAIPFAALRDTKRGARLIEEFPIVAVNSLSEFLRCAARDGVLGRHAPERVAVDGAAGGDAGMRAVDVSHESARVVRVYGRGVARQDDAVTKTRFLTDAAAADVVHFGGHAVVNRGNPLYSALVVHAVKKDEQYLYAYTIAASRFPRTRIVVLSACDSARWGRRRNASVGSLARAFVAAGVPTVVGTLWPVQDGESDFLLRRLHEEIRNGRDAASALRAAQLAAMKKQPTAVWAAFQVTGGVKAS